MKYLFFICGFNGIVCAIIGAYHGPTVWTYFNLVGGTMNFILGVMTIYYEKIMAELKKAEIKNSKSKQ